MKQAVGTVLVELEVTINAPRERVWQALTQEINAWWLSDYRMIAPDSVVTLDARAGGLMIEQKPDGGSLLWYTVAMVTPGTTLHMVGHMAPPWGGPAVAMLELTLQADGAGTRLEIRDAILGPESTTQAANLDAGWRALFGDGLKAYVEGAR